MSEEWQKSFIQDPFKGMKHEDFVEALDARNWKVSYERLHTPNFEAVLISESGHLILLFPDGQRRDFERSDVEALTRFLDQFANVQPLPVPDEDIFKDFKPNKV